MQVFKRFPLLHPLQYLAAPAANLKALSAMKVAVRDGVLQRIERRCNTEHVDLFDYILPAEQPVPSDQCELVHIGALAQQMMFANYGPMSDWFYGTILFLLQEPECLQHVSKEIRNKFESYQDITPSALSSLSYLHACLEESLRLLPGNNTGLPRISPGAIIDGNYVSKGVSFPPLSSLSFAYLTLGQRCPRDQVLKKTPRPNRPMSKRASSRWLAVRVSFTSPYNTVRSAGFPPLTRCTIQPSQMITWRVSILSVLVHGPASDAKWRGWKGKCSSPKFCGHLMWLKCQDKNILIWMERCAITDSWSSRRWGWGSSRWIGSIYIRWW